MAKRRSSKAAIREVHASEYSLELLDMLQARRGLVCGIDEAGRGPLAGPVTAAAVILPDRFPLELLDDSKRMSERARVEASVVIMERAIGYGIGWAWPEEIDRFNILRASLLAMMRAHGELVRRHEAPADSIVVVDGPYTPAIDGACYAVVGGDRLVPEIQAASILAKTARDRWMTRYSWIDDRYGYDRHKGYPTAAHRLLCLRYGPSPIQRHTFRVRPPTPADGIE